MELAKLIGDIATGQVTDKTDDGKSAAAIELGRRGGLKGGKARAKALSPELRRQLALNAAQIRWRGVKKAAK